MKLAGFNFSKVSIEKKSNNYKDIKISSGINILSIEEVKTNLETSENKFLAVKWKYSISYSPKIAEINFEGNIVVSVEKDIYEKIISEWKDKKIENNFNFLVLNLILKKCSVKAIQLEDEFSLPLHFKMPSVKKKD
jgi:hypothetical protein